MVKNITISLADELAEKIGQYPEVNWSQVARSCIESYVNNRSTPDLTELMDNLVKEKGAEYANGKVFAISFAKEIGYRKLTSLYRKYTQERQEWDEFAEEGRMGPGVKYDDEDASTLIVFGEETAEDFQDSSPAFLNGFREVIDQIVQKVEI